MPRLRLFGPAAQVAGRAHDEIPATSVEELLATTRARYGEQFGLLLSRSRVWVNGSDPDPDASLGEDDEVAILPPVSGG